MRLSSETWKYNKTVYSRILLDSYWHWFTMHGPMNIKFIESIMYRMEKIGLHKKEKKVRNSVPFCIAYKLLHTRVLLRALSLTDKCNIGLPGSHWATTFNILDIYLVIQKRNPNVCRNVVIKGINCWHITMILLQNSANKTVLVHAMKPHAGTGE